MTLKISSGWSKGLKILTPEGLDTRPTTGRVRESAINLIQPWIKDSIVVDLYAGSGAVGLELISRGARGAIFVEKASKAVKCLDENIKAFLLRASQQGIAVSPIDVQHCDLETFMSRPTKFKFDIIWADPPYDRASSFLDSAIPLLKRIANPGAILALESSHQSLPLTTQASEKHAISIEKQRRYGISLITIWNLN